MGVSEMNNMTLMILFVVTATAMFTIMAWGSWETGNDISRIITMNCEELEAYLLDQTSRIWTQDAPRALEAARTLYMTRGCNQ